jgi:hypothetical protein
MSTVVKRFLGEERNNEQRRAHLVNIPYTSFSFYDETPSHVKGMQMDGLGWLLHKKVFHII